MEKLEKLKKKDLTSFRRRVWASKSTYINMPSKWFLKKTLYQKQYRSSRPEESHKNGFSGKFRKIYLDTLAKESCFSQVADSQPTILLKLDPIGGIALWNSWIFTFLEQLFYR